MRRFLISSVVPLFLSLALLAVGLPAASEASGPTPVTGSSFVDVPSDHLFASDIAWLASEGITRGCNPHEGNTRFCPDNSVTREQMASFLVRALSLPGATSDFSDVAAGNPHRTDISALAAAGITRGCNPGEGNTRFCPEDSVTRGQFAAFLVRALNLSPSNQGFTDTADHVFEADVAALAVAGITRGCNPGEGNTRFCPDESVTRAQMAAFLKRALSTDDPTDPTDTTIPSTTSTSTTIPSTTSTSTSTSTTTSTTSTSTTTTTTLPPPFCADVSIPTTECEALVALYDSTDGDSWNDNDGWLVDDPCDWVGVTCSSGHVLEIDLHENGLAGEIPSEIGSFTNVELLDLGWNDLSGPIRSEIGQLTNLTHLYLDGNSLTGAIPAELSQLANLQLLILEDNSLSGHIPSELMTLSNLTQLLLDNNGCFTADAETAAWLEQFATAWEGGC